MATMVLGASSKKKRANNDIDDETYSLVIKMAMGNPTSTNDFPINHPVYMYIYIYSYIIYIYRISVAMLDYQRVY